MPKKPLVEHTPYPLYYPTPPPKKDKKKLAIANRLSSMEDRFYDEKNKHYQAETAAVQQDLAQAQTETDPVFLERLRNSQERRDYELTRLLHWERYLVSRVEAETREDLETINEEYANFIKIIKDKLYEKLVRKIKLLKEDKVLKDLANVNHYTIDLDLMENTQKRPREETIVQELPKKLVSITEGHGSDTERRPRRTRIELSYNTDSNLSGNDSLMAGYISALGKRRRFQTARAAASGIHNTRSYLLASEENFLSDNNSLSEILFGKQYLASGGGNKTGKGGPRAKLRQFMGVPSLNQEDVDEDLAILEGCLGAGGVLFSKK